MQPMTEEHKMRSKECREQFPEETLCVLYADAILDSMQVLANPSKGTREFKTALFKALKKVETLDFLIKAIYHHELKFETIDDFPIELFKYINLQQLLGNMISYSPFIERYEILLIMGMHYKTFLQTVRQFGLHDENMLPVDTVNKWTLCDIAPYTKLSSEDTIKRKKRVQFYFNKLQELENSVKSGKVEYTAIEREIRLTKIRFESLLTVEKLINMKVQLDELIAGNR